MTVVLEKPTDRHEVAWRVQATFAAVLDVVECRLLDVSAADPTAVPIALQDVGPEVVGNVLVLALNTLRTHNVQPLAQQGDRDRSRTRPPAEGW